MFTKTCLVASFISVSLLFVAGIAWGKPLVINNGFICPTRETAMDVVKYEQSIIKEGTEVTAEEYGRKTKEIGCTTLFGVEVEKLEEVLPYTGVYPIAGVWVPVDVVVVRAKIRQLDTGEVIEGFIFLPASMKFPGEVAI
ncbi:MAG: hypothetical protein Q7S52_05965 [bacterium]|nr:hypothetical protein [bacterium]